MRLRSVPKYIAHIFPFATRAHSPLFTHAYGAQAWNTAKVGKKGRIATVAKAALLCAVVLVQSGCVLPAIIAAGKELGMTPSDRRMLLEKEMKEYRQALMLQKPQDAFNSVSTDSVKKIKDHFKAKGKDEHIVDQRIENVEYEASTTEANVEIVVRYYKVPFYIVNERTEIERWVFEGGNGWKLHDIENVEAAS